MDVVIITMFLDYGGKVLSIFQAEIHPAFLTMQECLNHQSIIQQSAIQTFLEEFETSRVPFLLSP